jgi:hypothetical protein
LKPSKLADKLKDAIAADVADIDGDTPEPKKTGPLVPCTCTGGPSNHHDFTKRGTGLLDDNTVCPKCHGSGLVSA